MPSPRPRTHMRTLHLAAVLAVCVQLVASPARGDEAGAIRLVIASQIEAFRKDDGATAFAFASPAIQSKFATPESFMRMVARAYPQVYRPRTFRFLGLDESRGRIIQRVLVEGPDGRLVTAVYIMQKLDGDWRIAGCYLVKSGQGV